MIKEINFGSAIKLGKTLELSFHNVRGTRWKVTLKGDEFSFEDTKGEWPTTYTTKANVKFWVLEKEELKIEEPKTKGK